MVLSDSKYSEEPSASKKSEIKIYWNEEAGEVSKGMHADL